MTITPQMAAALASPNPFLFGAIKVILPTRTILLLDGSGKLMFGGDTYTGKDSVFGAIGAIDFPEDGFGDQAPAIGISFSPPSASAAAELASPAFQGSVVKCFWGAIDRATGQPIPDPIVFFDGHLDQAELELPRGSPRTVTFECTGFSEPLFEVNEGHLLSDSFHQHIWPGEEGMEHIDGVARQIIWGPGEKVGGGSGYSYGGGGGGGGRREPPNYNLNLV